MSLKKILASTMAAALAVGSMAVCASAETEFTWELAGQFDSSFNDAEEWPEGLKGTGKTNEEITAVWEFDDNVKLAANYFGFKTEGVVWNTEEGAVNDVYLEVISFKADGREIAVDNDKMKANCTDNDSASGNLKCVFYNEWDKNTQGNAAIDVEAVNGEEGFTKLEVVFKVVEPVADTNSGDTTSDAAATEAPATEAPATSAAGDVNQATDDKNSPDTGVEGVAVVAGLAVVAAGAIVVAKKRK